MTKYTKFIRSALLVSLITIVALAGAYAQKKQFTYPDIMKFKALQTPVFSYDGAWLAFTEKPERGDPNVVVQSVDVDSIKYTIKRGARPKITRNGQWVAATVQPKSLELENLERGADRPKSGMALLATASGRTTSFDAVEQFEFSNDSKWLVYRSAADDKIKPDKKKKTIIGQNLTLRQLETGSELTFNFVNDYAIDSLSRFLAYSVADPDKKHNGVYIVNLNGGLMPTKISDSSSTYFSELLWNNSKSILAFISAKARKDDDADTCSVNLWNASAQTLQTIIKPTDAPANFFVPFKNHLQWTKDGERLYFGFKPAKDTALFEEKVTFADSTFYDENTILKKIDGDVWHWNDPRIKTVQKVWWKQNKDRVFNSVYHLGLNKMVVLATNELPDLLPSENSHYALGYDDQPYLKEATWEGDYQDVYAVNLMTGEKKVIKKHLEDNAYISPAGKYALYFFEKNWYLYDFALDTTTKLTEKTNAIFYDDESDVPNEPGSFGIAGWMENDDAVIINSKYDLYKFYTGRGNSFVNITGGDGLAREVSFRVRKLDPEAVYFKKNETLILSAVYDKTKENVFFTCNTDAIGTDTLIYDKKRFRIVEKARSANRIFFTREDYNEFPDIWVTDSTFKKSRRLTDVNPQMKEFLWGTPELVNWTDDLGEKLQGYIIKPENFDPAKRYPVVVYFYERYSDMLYYFSQPYTGHRLCWQQYAGDGYIMFMPDVKYKVGAPGESALRCITSGLRHLVGLGYADSAAIGVWGHSWSGYQTAYMINRTNMFKAAVAGATVGNMTSAYSGLRHESGRARQFQYEHGQSRIGGTLWDSLTNYIDNSPIFGANKARTPLLIMAGDEDQMVPWQQSIEIYLAMRRLEKNCIFLQYHGEPHWPEKYPNRLDYAKKIKEFFDTYLKDKPAPEWILDGVEYKGK